ncbi:HAD family hydrolase [Geminocystis herdmanii]|uniref:HAD family hydrolase n=1 Tax=Geminocystis herdmanii TaxID=669359 RepID=UPI00034AD27E|nr:HAD family hydrolase [Geminocystis herdmanii]
MKILVTDFDGVICDGLREYFYSSKLVYQKIWFDRSSIELDSLQSQFNLLRPMVETGWEMPLLLRVLTWGETPENILENWYNIKEKAIKILNLQGIKIEIIAKTLDEIREQQIKDDLDRWLSLQEFYAGVKSKLQQLMNRDIKIYIITTKEGKFARKLLEKEGIYLPENTIFGKEVKRPKYETLRLIIQQEKIEPSQVCFIEDRLEALALVNQQSDLQEVKLFLALWGYNTEKTKLQAQEKPKINLLSLANFTGNDVF